MALNLAEKIAKKTFLSPDFQKSWSGHMAAFGPILEPAFAEDYQSLVHLTAALNLISNRKIGEGLKKLQSLQGKCKNDTDKAALLFFMGVCFEMGGHQEQMLECYTYANEYGHRFYLPYLKVAKFYLNGCIYDKAADNFSRGIDCFTATGLDDQSRMILSSAYTNYATCLMMMHRYEEAETALATSRTLYPDAPGRAATEASLHAIRGNTEQLEVCLAALKDHAPEIWEDVKKTTDRILAHTDPLFYPMELDGGKISEFWQWFAGREAELVSMLDREQYEEAVGSVADQLLEAFPFLEERPYIALGKDEAGYILELHDMYAVAVANAYETLLQSRPGETSDHRIRFVIVH